MHSSVLFVAALALLASVAHAQTPVRRTTYSVNCGTLSNCESCSEKHYVGGNLAKPCYWDPERLSCGSMPHREVPCQGNIDASSATCRQCETAWKNKQAQKAKTAAGGAGGSAAGGAGSGAGAGTAAGGAKPRNRCVYKATAGPGLPGICVFSSGQCRGNPAMKGGGCTDPNKSWCCAAAIKSGKAAKSDRCSVYTNKCFDCVRAGCVMHKRSGMCVGHLSNMGRAGADNLIADDRFCSDMNKVKAARVQRIAQRQAAKQAKNKK